jgi:succinate dehydrogenase/fumarate reductase-like Fe-S protein
VKITLRIWRQQHRDDPGRMVTYHLDDISPDMSFLEMLDVLNEQLMLSGDDPVAFDSACREGICGACGLVINGIAHGPQAAIATCQLQMRSFRDGDVIDVEPWRAKPFPVLKDLVVDRSALDRIIQAGGYISAPTGARRMPTPRWSPRPLPTAHSTPLYASDAVPAWPPARTAPQCCSPERKSLTWDYYTKARRSGMHGHWR